MTPDNPCMTLDLNIVLRSGQWSFWPSLVVLGHSYGNYPLDNPDDPSMTFDPNVVVHSGQWFFWPSLVVLGHSHWNWPLDDPDDPCMTFDLNIVLCLGQWFFWPSLVVLGHSQGNWPLDDPRWPLHDLGPQHCSAFRSVVLLTKFGGPRTFPWQLTPLTPRWPLTSRSFTSPLFPHPLIIVTKFGLNWSNAFQMTVM